MDDPYQGAQQRGRDPLSSHCIIGIVIICDAATGMSWRTNEGTGRKSTSIALFR